MEHDEDLAALLRAIATLPTECKRVLTLRKVYGWKQERIAEHLGMEEHVVKNHLCICALSLGRAL